jgi:hypothetical protein
MSPPHAFKRGLVVLHCCSFDRSRVYGRLITVMCLSSAHLSNISEPKLRLSGIQTTTIGCCALLRLALFYLKYHQSARPTVTLVCLKSNRTRSLALIASALCKHKFIYTRQTSTFPQQDTLFYASGVGGLANMRPHASLCTSCEFFPFLRA